MTSWQKKGFVEDSEDEGSLGSLDAPRTVERTSTRRLSPKVHIYSNPGRQTDNSHLETERPAYNVPSSSPAVSDDEDLREEASARVLNERESTDRTPPGSSTSAILAHLLGRRTTTHEAVADLPSSEAGTSASAHKIPRVVERAPSLVLDDEIIYPDHPIRSLRSRKPIQLHPYRLEGEKYKHAFKARGLRPVQVVSESQDARRRGQDDSQRQEDSWQSSQMSFGDDAGQDEDMFASSPPSVAANASSRSTSHHSQEINHAGQLSSIISHQWDDGSSRSKRLRNGKRRKVLEYTNKYRNLAGAAEADVHTDDLGRGKTSIFDIPPSPPPSSPPPNLSKDDTPLGKLKRMHNKATPLKPLTPTTSSATAKVLDELTPVPRSAKSSTLRPPHEVTVIESDIESNLSSSSSDGEKDIRAATRRIKGVLPASWLKLDQKAHAPKQPAIVRAHRPEIRSIGDGKGVAHRKLGRMTSASVLDAMFLSQDDSSESDRVIPNALQSSKKILYQPRLDFTRIHEPVQFSLRADEDPGSGMEDDRFDHMTTTVRRPARPANGKVQKQPKHRQSTLGKSVSESRQRASGDTSTKLKSSRTNNGQRSRGNDIAAKRPRVRAVPLSIVDQIPSSPEAKAAVPQFIRVAARAAALRPKEGRHSPTRKFVQLATHQDTLEAVQTLRQWRTGKAKPKKPSDKAHRLARRPPLAERSGNIASTAQAYSNHSHVNRSLQSGHLPDLTEWVPPVIADVQVGKDAEQSRTVEQSRKVSRHNPGRQFDIQLEEGTDAKVREHPVTFATSAQHQMDDLLGHQLDQPLEQHLSEQPDASLAAQSLTARYRDISRAVNQVRSIGSRRPRAPRKLPPIRLDITARDYQQEQQVIDSSSTLLTPVETTEALSGPVLQDLYGYGHRYPIAFDIQALPKAKHFDRSTFVGSGQFQRCLRMDHRDSDIDVGSCVQTLGALEITWGRWDQAMAEQIHRFLEQLCTLLSDVDGDSTTRIVNKGSIEDISRVLRSFIDSTSTWLSFSDSVDRQDFSAKLVPPLDMLVSLLASLLGTSHVNDDHTLATNVRHATAMALSILSQLWTIDRQHSTESKVSSRLETLLYSTSEALLRSLLSKGTYWLRTVLDEARRRCEDHTILPLRDADLECLVILRHVSDCTGAEINGFWRVFNAIQKLDSDQPPNLQDLESQWMTMTTVLPALSISQSGSLPEHDAMTTGQDNWQLVKALVTPVLEAYSVTSRLQGSSINDYVRALLSRCVLLIQDWRWHRCEAIIGVFFDFFAKTHLAGLPRETVHGSPNFLNELNDNSPLSLQHGEGAFHIFLKLVASGLRAMNAVYPAKKIRNIAWRCIPNHGRSYPKDQPLLETDLQALRNHHDLLCTLYWASPAGFRPPIRLIKILVDHNTSHRQACRLSIRSWTNLASFAMASGMCKEDLEPFATWFSEIISQSIAQFRQARVEAESHLEEARRRGQDATLAASFNAIVERNQSQIVATLCDAVYGMKQAIQRSQDTGSAVDLLRSSGIDNVLGLFDPRNARISNLLIDTLDVFRTLHDRTQQRSDLENQQPAREESQDYGDWPDSDEDHALVIGSKQTDASLTSSYVLDSIFRLLSNVFGAESEPDDSLCTRAIDIWISLATHEVQQRRREWSELISGLGSFSWSQLRATLQHRKYTPYFLAAMLRADGKAYVACKDSILTSWMVSLVERESLLKHQHDLTNAILNSGCDDNLLANLPFFRTGHAFSITLHQIRDRRLNLISAVLSNIQSTYRTSVHNGLNTPSLRQSYTTLLKSFTVAMKTNFLEVAQSEQDTTRGAYVSFVQQIVEFLQQYTSDVCAIDKFFTDSSAFPLSVHDPTYVVGKLRAYAGRLRDTQALKQLVIFLQAVSERAATDGQQDYLTGQLVEAMSGDFEYGGDASPTLRAMLLSAILPAYLKLAFSSATGWILAIPIMGACTQIFAKLHTSFSVLDQASQQATERLLQSFLQTIQESSRLIVDHPGFLEQPSIIRTITGITDLTVAAAPSIDYIARHSRTPMPLQQGFTWIFDLTTFIEAYLHDPGTAVAPDDHDLEGISGEHDKNYDSMRAFCSKELSDGLAQRWTIRDGRYFVKRGQMQTEVAVDLGPHNEETARLQESIARLRETLGGPVSFNDQYLDDIDISLL